MRSRSARSSWRLTDPIAELIKRGLSQWRPVNWPARNRATRPKGRPTRCGARAACPRYCTDPRPTPMAIAIDRVELKARGSRPRRAQRIIRLKSSSPELDDKHVIFKDIQRAPVVGRNSCTPISTRSISTAPIRVEVPLRFIGKATGVADGGILQPLCAGRGRMPAAGNSRLDRGRRHATLDIHDVIHVSAVKFPGKVKPIFDTDYPVVTVLPPTVAEVAGRRGRGSRGRRRCGAEGARRQKALLPQLPPKGGRQRRRRQGRRPRSPRRPRRRSSCSRFSCARVAQPSPMRATRASNIDVRANARAQLATLRVRCRGRGPL